MPTTPWLSPGLRFRVQERRHLSCNQKVQLPVATWEAGANVKDGGLFSSAGNLEGGGLTSQSTSTSLSGGRGFYKEGTGKQNEEINGGRWEVLYVQMSTVHPDEASDRPVCSLLVSRPGFTLFSLHVILASQLKVSKSPGTGTPEGRGL